MTQHDINSVSQQLEGAWQAPPPSDDAIARILGCAEALPAVAMATAPRASRQRLWFTGLAVAASIVAVALWLPKFVATSVATDTTASLLADNETLNGIFATNEEEDTLL